MIRQLLNKSALKKQPFKKWSLKKQYLHKMLPAFLLVLAFFIAEIFFQHIHKQRALQSQLIQLHTEQTAHLLQEPVWQFSDSVIQNILTRLYREAFVHCVRLEHVRDLRDPVVLGKCDQMSSGAELYTHNVVYQAPNGPREIAQLRVFASSSVSLLAMFRELIQTLLLTLVIFGIFVFFTLRTFKTLVLRPMKAFSHSLRHYQATGVRKRVNWESDDELGHLIKEYNVSLDKQLEAENQAHAARRSVEEALQKLKHAQNELIQSEKMASLGGLVAGIAHEINTPLGNSMTVATTVLDKTDTLNKRIHAGQLTRSDLSSYLATMEDAGQLLYRNIQKAADLITNFKQVAVDQTSAQRRSFDLQKTLEDMLYTLKPQLKSTPHTVHLDIAPNIKMDSYPGPLGQIVSNLISNALLHAFEDKQAGEICIFTQSVNQETIELVVQDNGVGMSPDLMLKAFDPFFTTKLGQGGSGLGLHIVYNLVHGVLGGEISLTHPQGRGLVFVLSLPKVAPDKALKGKLNSDAE